MAYRDIIQSLGIDEKQWDLKARFGAFLLHVPGVKNEYVAHILAKYPTFALLKRALDSHSRRAAFDEAGAGARVARRRGGLRKRCAASLF